MMFFYLSENGCTYQDIFELGSAEHRPNHPDRWGASQVHRHYSGSHNPHQNCEYDARSACSTLFNADQFVENDGRHRESRLHDSRALSILN